MEKLVVVKKSLSVPVAPCLCLFGSRRCNPSISVDMTPEILGLEQSAPVAPLNYKCAEPGRRYVLH